MKYFNILLYSLEILFSYIVLIIFIPFIFIILFIKKSKKNKYNY